MCTQNKKAVLLLGYGSPRREREIEEFFQSVCGERPLSKEKTDELKSRYAAIGGVSPYSDITYRQAGALAELLGDVYKVYVGMRHSRPNIKDAVDEIKKDNMREVTAVVLAPHYSRLSVGAYGKKLAEAASGMRVRFIESWHLEPKFIECAAVLLNETLAGFDGAHVIFTAHSLPVRIREWNDPYEKQFLETCVAVAEKADVKNWSCAFQSRGMPDEEWLGPSLNDELLKHGKKILVCPVGFVADNLETLYDIDIDANNVARDAGVFLRRVGLCNTSTLFIEALKNIAARTML